MLNAWVTSSQCSHFSADSSVVFAHYEAGVSVSSPPVITIIRL